MPECAGFATSLISQYDAATLPETHVRVLATSTLRSLNVAPVPCDSPAPSKHPDKTFAGRRDSDAAGTVVEARVPVLPGSQFWVCYRCPVPPFLEEGEGEEDHDEEDRVKYCYFKLSVSGQCVLSWGVGEKEQWRGKMMFGLFDGGRDFEGRRIVEKRGLFFPTPAAGPRKLGGQGFEVKIFRAKARRMEVARYQGSSEVVGGVGGGKAVEFTNIGKSQRGERRRWYSYALIDAVDEPYLTFRYRFEADEDVTPRMESTLLSADVEDTTTTDPIDATESSLWSDLEQNTPQAQHFDDVSLDAVGSNVHGTAIRRLSFPPRSQLLPSTSVRLGSWPSPTKSRADPSDDGPVRPRPGNIESLCEPSPRRATCLRKREWTAARTASPAEGFIEFEEAATLASHRKSASTSGSGGLLRSVVASALRKKEERSR